jgi:type I restriction enzyme S subunit
VGFPENIQGRQYLAVPVFKVGDISLAAREGRTLLDTSPNTVDQKTAGNLMKVLIPPGATVFAKIGAAIGLNRRAITARPCIVDNNVMAAVPNTNCIEPLYLFQFMQTVHLLEKSQATTVPSVRKGDIEDIPIPLAPLPEQRSIVEALDSYLTRLDAATEGLKRVEANLKRYRASVLKAAVDGKLVPTEADLAKKEKREFEPASVLLERILKERRHRWEQAELAKMRAKGEVPKNDKWKDKYEEPATPDTSELPELPEGWCWTTVSQLVAHEEYSLAIGPFGSNLKVSDYADDGVPLVFVRNIRAEQFTELDDKFVSREKSEELRAHTICGGDLLVTKMGDPPGDVAIYPIGAPNAIITADCIKLRAQVLLNSEFLLWMLRSASVQSFISGITKGVAQKKVSLGRFAHVTVPLAPLSEQFRIAAEISRLQSEAVNTVVSVSRIQTRIDRLRQSILRWAFEGKLVDQDPNDEPASVLLERIRSERESSKPVKTSKPERAKRKTA